VARRREENLFVKSAVADMLKGRGRLRKAVKQKIPKGRERDYLAAILRQLRPAREIAQQLFVQQLREIERQANDSAMRADGYAQDIETLMGQVRVRYAQEVPASAIQATAAAAGRNVELFQSVQLNRVFKSALNIDVDAMFPDAAEAIEAFTVDNVSLIKTVPEKYFAEIEQTAIRNIRAGRRFSDWQGEIAKRFDVAKSRAALIARDQVNKFNGELNRVRQQALGIRTYTWRDSNDDRVRETHQEFDGNTYAWSGEPAPPEGHPGQPINCRCNADPNVESVLTETERGRL
jgi:SPP1 gp7 family putative phage head morphogenesis protein